MQAVPLDDEDDYYDFDRMGDETTQRQIFANFAKLKRRDSSDGSHIESEREKLAHETARLIQLEVQRWEASVVELEEAAMLPPVHRNNVVFPTMPAVVMDEQSHHHHPSNSSAPPLVVTVPPQHPPSPRAPLAVADWNDSEDADEAMDDTEGSDDLSILGSHHDSFDS